MPVISSSPTRPLSQHTSKHGDALHCALDSGSTDLHPLTQHEMYARIKAGKRMGYRTVTRHQDNVVQQFEVLALALPRQRPSPSPFNGEKCKYRNAYKSGNEADGAALPKALHDCTPPFNPPRTRAARGSAASPPALPHPTHPPCFITARVTRNHFADISILILFRSSSRNCDHMRTSTLALQRLPSAH